MFSNGPARDQHEKTRVGDSNDNREQLPPLSSIVPPHLLPRIPQHQHQMQQQGVSPMLPHIPPNPSHDGRQGYQTRSGRMPSLPPSDQCNGHCSKDDCGHHIPYSMANLHQPSARIFPATATAPLPPPQSRMSPGDPKQGTGTNDRAASTAAGANGDCRLPPLSSLGLVTNGGWMPNLSRPVTTRSNILAPFKSLASETTSSALREFSRPPYTNSIGGPRLAASDVPTTLGSAATTIITTIALNSSNGGGGGSSSSNSNSNSNIRHFEKNRGSGSMGDTKQAYMGGWDAQFPWLNWSSRFGKYSNKAKDNQWLSTKMPQSLGDSTSLLSQQRLATSSLPTEPKSSPQSRDLANNATPAFSAPAIAKNNEQCGEKRAQRWNKKPSSDHKHRGEAVSVCSLDRDRWDQGVTNVDGGNGAAAAAAAATEANSFVVEKLGNSQQYDSDGNPRPQQCLWSTCAQIFSSIDDLVRHLYKLHVATNRSSQNATNPNGRLGELTTGSKGLGSSSSSGSEQGAVFLDASESNTRDNLSDDEDLSSEDGDDYAGGGSSTADFLCKWASCRALKHDTDELIQHVCRDHLGAARIIYRCHWSQCHEEYESIDDLTSHLSNDHVGSGKHEYMCWWEGCERNGKPFTQRQRAMRHIQTHTCDKPFSCKVCNKRFSEAHIMQQHMRVHTGEKPFKCTESGCAKEFAVSSALTIHLRTHTGEKPYQCRFMGCTKRFAESSNLTKHMRVHTGEKPFKCPNPACGKTFSRPDQVTRHQRMHTGERPFTCPVEKCNRTFSTSTGRLNHVRHLHLLNIPSEMDAGANKRHKSDANASPSDT